MSAPHIRRCVAGEEASLFDIYFTSIHLVASHDYTPEQVQAWAPRDLDEGLWARKMQEINPLVADLNGELVGYADVQSNGHIDHFFVFRQASPPWHRVSSYGENTCRSGFAWHFVVNI
jgi:putative acetyltransferase